MFKKFTASESVSGSSQAKASVVRGIRAKLSEQYPQLAHYIDDIIPKKEPIHILKCHDHIEILVRKNELLLFRQRDGPYIPTLRLLHKYPKILPWVQVDKGAIKFLLSGANVMCPGLTSPGARMDVSLPQDTVVSSQEELLNETQAVMAEGKEHCVSIGITKMSTEEIARVNKGVGVENIHFLCDGLWNMKEFHR